MQRLTAALSSVLIMLGLAAAAGAGPIGFYRQPALHGETIVFVAEGDLWKVSIDGGVATRLTSHPSQEGMPAISPDGLTVAFVGRYEGPRELYTMPLDGGRPTRRTYRGTGIEVIGWSADQEVLITSQVFSTLPNWQLVRIDVSRPDAAGQPTVVPLHQAGDGEWADDGTLYFTRLRFQGSHTKRYQGGTAQNIWKFDGAGKAQPMTADYPGTSKRPMLYGGRIYFASDRDGTMNLWSMAPDGSDLQQHTRHSGWEVQSPTQHGGRIVYQLGADLHLFDIASATDHELDITLDTDLDQTRENWVGKPFDFVTTSHISPDGDRVVLTARGKLFVVPVKQGRLVNATPETGVRHRDARFLPDGDTLLSLADGSGEVELWTRPANGVGGGTQLTDDGGILRWEAVPSPDGKQIAHIDKAHRLFLYDAEAGTNQLIATNEIDRFYNLSWSPDSRWLAYTALADNMFNRVWVVDATNGETRPVTSDRYDSWLPSWGSNGEWLYLQSDRHLESVVGSPWGNYQPEPFLDKRTKLYGLALTAGLRSPFAPDDEVADARGQTESADGEEEEEGAEEEAAVIVEIDFDGIERRLHEVPVPPGNYSGLGATEDTLFWMSNEAGSRESDLHAVKIGNEDTEVQTVASGIRGYEISQDGKKLLLRKSDGLFVVDAKAAEADLSEAGVDLSGWRLSVQPQEEWRQMLVEAWRLERDYFYDPGMHGVDWDGMLQQYLPLVDRVTDRAELANLTAQMVSELSALHTFVFGGDHREGPDDISVGSLGALTVRDEGAGGYRVERLYRSDPDEPERASPLARQTVEIREGDVIEAVNGRATLEAADLGELLRHQTGKQVLLRVKPATGGPSRDVIVEPFSQQDEWDLRYHEWEYTRRLAVDEMSDREFGYVHMRAMGRGNFTEWARGYYPVFHRKGLIIDMRRNRGGNIDSWILNRLLRRVWFYWSQHSGHAPSWNMQQAFRGHMVVLIDENTASDGEAFAEGFRRLGLGKLIGTRTWGGEIWLTGSNSLVDGGVATAAEFGVYGPEGEWLIEGWGVEPDILVDNLPHETFNGRDAQLEAAVEHLKQRLAEEPIPDYPVPEHPDKSTVQSEE